MIFPVTASPAIPLCGPCAALRQRSREILFCILFAGVLAGAFFSANADDLPPGFTVTPTLPRYLVLRDAFVRELPDNAAERIGGVAKGQRIAVQGKVIVPKTKDTHWLAIRMRDGRIGYVFGTQLLPVIDGTLRTPLTGSLAAPQRPDCRYSVTFTGKSQVADDPQLTADYDVEFDCMWKGAALGFSAGMFITELPFQDRRDVFQINIDLWDMRVNDEEVLSVTALYDPLAKRVAFESVNDDTLGDGKGIEPRTAEDVPGALGAALAIAHRVWRERAWEILATMPKPEPADGPAELNP
jgi:hypothetical protein